MPGIIIEKKFVEAKGKNYGTRRRSCAPARSSSVLAAGRGVTVVANDELLGPPAGAASPSTVLRACRTNAFASRLLTGEIAGDYTFQLTTLNQLKQSYR